MQTDERDLLEVLRFELNFLEKGGYGRSPREAWRPQFIFEDSPTCMNYDSKENPEPCSHCVLMQLVPPGFRSAKTPCRHILLNEAGESLDSLYRYDDQPEIEESVGNWLRTTIATLEESRTTAQLASPGHVAAPDSTSVPGTPLFQKFHPKCANPACPTAFHWLGGGKFFRFRPDEIDELPELSAHDASGNLHGVKHFWLCERCCHVFTLVHDPQHGIVIQLLWPELPLAETHKQLPAASPL
ncbi:MAG: hypothetical protein WCA00_07340 [Candidatus Acidiferrales bacterium]